jgi:predicted ABC-type ATPase
MSKLDDELHKKIFDEQIVTVLNDVGSQTKPRAIILAGQPGAGKGAVAAAALHEFGRQAVVVDPDQMRDFYPDVRGLKARNPYSWADQTHEDASQWAKELRAAAMDQKKNLIIDTTLGKYESAAVLVSELQKKGYEVEVRALATHRLESELGVEARFAMTMGKEGHGRYVPAHIQEEVYAKLPDNLDQLREVKGVPIRIFDREGTELYDSKKQSTTPGASLKAEREHRLESVDRSRQLAEGWNGQVAWHGGAKAALEGIPGVKPATVAKFLEQREEFGIVRRTAERAAEAQTNLHRLAPPSMAASSSAVTPIRLDNSTHPDHAMYKQALDKVQAMDKKYAHPSDERSINLAASLTVAARASGMERIDGVALNADRSQVVAAQGQPSMGNFNKFAAVDTVKGLDTPVAESSRRWPLAMEKFQQQQPAQTQAQQAPPHIQAKL